MKLRNKKTGEIGYLIADRGSDYYVVDKHGYNCGNKYNSLAELTEEWEDYEEPKEWWYIDIHGPHKVINSDEYYQKVKNASKEIGNYFETKEEAEKAVEKLKAVKRLKDKGFRFEKWVNVSGDGCSRPIWFYFRKDTQLEDVKPDLDLLFRGEE